MSITLTALQKQRRDTAANWTAANPTLLAGEIGIESDTNKIKIGNGSTAWTSLAYTPWSQLSAYPIVNADISATAEISVSKLADGTARQLLQTDAAGTGVEWTSNIDVPGTLDVTGAATFDNNVTVQGDLTVNGTTTTIDTTNLAIEDKNIEIGKVATPTDVTADGGGITLKGTTDKTISWIDSTDAWTFSEHVNIASAKEYRINGTKVLDATSLGSGVTGSSLTSVGTIGTGTWQGTTIATGYGGTGIAGAYTDGQLLIGKTDGTLAKATLTAGTGVSITNGNGTVAISATGLGGTVTAVTASSPLASTGGTTPNLSIQDGTTSQKGAVQLENSVSSVSTTTAATPSAVKLAYDLANAALPATGGTITGNLEIGATGSLSFEGSSSNSFETTFAVLDPSADRTITFPDISGTVITTSDTGTVTSTMILNGTILDADINASAAIATSKLADGSIFAKTNAVQTFSAAQRGGVVSLVDATTITPDFSLGNNFALLIAGNRTLANPTNLVPGQSGAIVITQDAIGTRTLAFGTYWKFTNAVAPILTATANRTDVLTYYVAASTIIVANLIPDVR